MYFRPFTVTGIRMRGQVRLSTERPPEPIQARYYPVVVEHGPAGSGGPTLLRSNPAATHQPALRRPTGRAHLQIQLRRNGRCRVWLSLTLDLFFFSFNLLTNMFNKTES